ncbi:hypothetical protein B9Z55_028827 [Caenorhabditis nigoni]|uniref:Uncharacterized protein n=1 Tax=Caenorhabditis nigoni TaxID=1611254 RepID=A0A2G5SA96_9PELO|nr:hypothetical protein B9Z55_028827 [Caenorhabditis nigoni]
MSFKSEIGQRVELAPMVDFSENDVTIELDHAEQTQEHLEDRESESEIMSDNESPDPLQMFAEIAGKVAREGGLPY